jgi:hypothetical protein
MERGEGRKQWKERQKGNSKYGGGRGNGRLGIEFGWRRRWFQERSEEQQQVDASVSFHSFAERFGGKSCGNHTAAASRRSSD